MEWMDGNGKGNQDQHAVWQMQLCVHRVHHNQNKYATFLFDGFVVI